MIYPREYPMSSLCQLRPVRGEKSGTKQNKIAGKLKRSQKTVMMIPPVSSSLCTSRRSLPLAMESAGCTPLSQLKPVFSQMIVHWSCMLTATKNPQPLCNATVYLFIYFKQGVLQLATATNWYPGKPKALFLMYRAFHGLEPNYLQNLLPPPHLLPWQLQSAEMLGLTSCDLLGYQGNSRGLSLSEFTPLLGSDSIFRKGRGRIN